jgi:DNA-binding LacI/PurR family transcriptional regulator
MLLWFHNKLDSKAGRGNHPAMAETPRVTLKDIAARLDVSHTTVSLALKDHHRISKACREKVQSVAKEMGYVPDPFLSALSAYRRRNELAKYQGTIAWVRHWRQSDFRNKLAYHRNTWLGACQAAKRFGYQVEEFVWQQDFSAKRFEQILLARGIQGILIQPHNPAPDWRGFGWNKYSIIRFGMSVPVPDTNLVTPDAFRNTALAVRKIHEYGYRRIGMVVMEHDQHIGGNFRGGFLEAQTDLKLTAVIPPLVSNGDVYQDDPKAANGRLRRWLKEYRPDAILTTEPHLPRQLRELGLSIPKDVALAATNIHDVKLDAGIDDHAEAVGRIAVEMLVKQINISERGEPEDPCRILVEGRWRDGKSLPRRRAT